MHACVCVDVCMCVYVCVCVYMCVYVCMQCYVMLCNVTRKHPDSPTPLLCCTLGDTLHSFGKINKGIKGI